MLSKQGSGEKAYLVKKKKKKSLGAISQRKELPRRAVQWWVCTERRDIPNSGELAVEVLRVKAGILLAVRKPVPESEARL